MKEKQETITGEPEATLEKKARKILPAHERIARDERRLAEQKDRLVQSLLGSGSGLIDDLRHLEAQCETALGHGASVGEVLARVQAALKALDAP